MTNILVLAMLVAWLLKRKSLALVAVIIVAHSVHRIGVLHLFGLSSHCSGRLCRCRRHRVRL